LKRAWSYIRIDRETVHPRVITLLEERLAAIRSESPPECVFALNLNGLRLLSITSWQPRTPPTLPAVAARKIRR
jgi:hypothetical protein